RLSMPQRYESLSAMRGSVATRMLRSKRACFSPQKNLISEILMPLDSAAIGSRLVLAGPVGFRLTYMSGLAEACLVRTSAPQLLGAPKSNWDHHDSESKRSRDCRKMLEGQHQQCICKNPDDDRRHAIQQVRRITHHERHFCAAEFREINPTEKSDRNTYQRGQQ